MSQPGRQVSIKINMFWMQDQVRHDAKRTFYDAIKDKHRCTRIRSPFHLCLSVFIRGSHFPHHHTGEQNLNFLDIKQDLILWSIVNPVIYLFIPSALNTASSPLVAAAGQIYDNETIL